jgi:hypothetical protein
LKHKSLVAIGVLVAFDPSAVATRRAQYSDAAVGQIVVRDAHGVVAPGLGAEAFRLTCLGSESPIDRVEFGLPQRGGA